MGILPDSGRAAERLDHEVMGWLTTVTANDRPQSSAVWFVARDDAIYIQSRPEAAKLRKRVEALPARVRDRILVRLLFRA